MCIRLGTCMFLGFLCAGQCGGCSWSKWITFCATDTFMLPACSSCKSHMPQNLASRSLRVHCDQNRGASQINQIKCLHVRKLFILLEIFLRLMIGTFEHTNHRLKTHLSDIPNHGVCGFHPYLSPHVRFPKHHRIVVPMGRSLPCCLRSRSSCSPLPHGVLLPVVHPIPEDHPTWAPDGPGVPTVTFTRPIQLCRPSILSRFLAAGG